MASSLLDLALNATLFIIPLIHLLLAPYSKVEESFNLQATHDILVYGVPVTNAKVQLSSTYDHFTFPGAVPRTFLGSVLLAGISQPIIALVGFAHAQFVVRALLGCFNAVSLLVFRRALDRAFGKATGRWWVALIAGQFHLAFYLTRTLPNMYSFGLTTLAAALIIPQTKYSLPDQKKSVYLLVISAAIFRSETAILLATTCLHLLINKRIGLLALIQTGIVCSFTCLVVSIPLDSYFWQAFPMWPELAGFYFNAVLGSSSEWGVSAWHFYFSSALPRVLLNPVTLGLIALAVFLPATRRQALDLTLPGLIFVAIYSIQPHKEARFIFYVIPSFTAAAALGASYLSNRATKATLYLAASAVVGLSVLACFAVSIGMLLLSSLNYPGGDAMNQLAALTSSTHDVSSKNPVRVHADVLTCMTGLTLFGQNPSGLPLAIGTPSRDILDSLPTKPLVLFDKNEDADVLLKQSFWKQFDYVLAEDPSKVIGGHWKTLGVVQGYDGIEILRPGQTRKYDEDAESGRKYHVLGRGAVVAHLREMVRKVTRGWWVGPRMSPKIFILQQVQDGAAKAAATM